MMSSYQFGEVRVGIVRSLFRRRNALLTVIAATCMASLAPARAQVVPAGDKGGVNLSAGATASGYAIQYGQQKLLGVTAFVDAGSRRRLGVEAEARWLMFHQTNGVKATTWSVGPRYHFSTGKLDFYGKGLVGLGQFTFPYNYAHGTYLVISPGGGVDYRWRRKISFRLADFEYQYWPEFTYGAMTTYGLSTGIRYHIF